MSGESLERRGDSFRKAPIAFWRMVFKCLVNRSLESRSRPRYLTAGDQRMGRCWMIRGFGRGGRQRKPVLRWEKCIERQGDYVEK